MRNFFKALILSSSVVVLLASQSLLADDVPEITATVPELAPQVPLAATLTFQSSAEVEGERLYLGNLATCRGMREICDEIYGIDLGPSPEPGRTITWHPERARTILAKEWPNSDIRIAGAKMMKITAASIPLTEERVEGALRTLFSDAFPEDGALKVAIDKVLLPPGLKLRPGDFTVEFPDLTQEHLEDPDWVIRHLSGNIRLTFQCRQPEVDITTTFSAATRLTVHALMPVTAQALDKGTEINEMNLKSEMIPLGRSGQQFASNVSQLTGRRLRRPLPSGSPILPSDVEMPRLVRRGQMVTLKVDGSGVAVSGPVKAMADGVTGQVIEAQYPATKKRMRVRVIDSNTVQHVF